MVFLANGDLSSSRLRAALLSFSPLRAGTRSNPAAEKGSKEKYSSDAPAIPSPVSSLYSGPDHAELARPAVAGGGLIKRRGGGAVALAVFALLAAGMLLIKPVAASAQTAIAGGSPANIALSIPVTASVTARCSFSITGTYDVPEITAGFTHDFGMVLQCSTAVRVAVVSSNGGLLAAIAAPPLGYSRLAPYSVTLNLVGNPGVPTTTSACAAAGLITSASPPCTFRGPVTSIQGLRLSGASTAASGSYLRVAAPAYSSSQTLVSSNTYADTLTVTVSTTI